ncbi:MAG: hypothetical protein IKZ02_03435, partial [Alphaproteobacteria bacterium]|nr:hypothetical protein [Alphaproteobacteria bacterium]
MAFKWCGNPECKLRGNLFFKRVEKSSYGRPLAQARDRTGTRPCRLRLRHHTIKKTPFERVMKLKAESRNVNCEAIYFSSELKNRPTDVRSHRLATEPAHARADFVSGTIP